MHVFAQRERERERERGETDRQTDKETDRQTETGRQRQTHRQAGRQRQTKPFIFTASISVRETFQLQGLTNKQVRSLFKPIPTQTATASLI